MASGQEMNFNSDSDRSASCTAGSNCHLSDFRSLPEENFLGSFSSNEGSQPLFHQYQGNESTVSQDIPSSADQSLSYEMNLIRLHLPQSSWILTVPESFRPLYHQSSENVLSRVQETQLFSDTQPEIRFSGNEDVVPHIPSPNTHSSDTVPSANQQLLSEWHKFSENKCNTIQERHSQAELGVIEFSATQGSYPLSQQFSENDTNRNKGYASLTQQQSENEPIASQSSYPLSHQPHQSISNIGATACSVSPDVFGNEFHASKATNIRSHFHFSGESRRIQDLPSQTFRHSECRSENIQSFQPQGLTQSENIQSFQPQGLQQSENIQSFQPQGLQQSESEPNIIRNTNYSGHLASGIDLIQDCVLYSPTREIPNRSFANQDLHSLTRHPVESETCEIQGLHPLPQAFTENNPNKPHLHSQELFDRESCAIPHTENHPSRSDISYPLPGNSPGTGNFINKKQTILSDQAPVNVIRMELQHPYSNRSEFINILVYGNADCTSRLLQTFAGGNPFKFVSPYSFVIQRNITRCGILMTVSVWQMDDLSKSSHFLRSTCAFSKSTIIFVLDVKDTTELYITLLPLIDLIRQDVSRSVPIIFVGSRGFAYTGFRLKARYDISAFLECSDYSTEEVNAVMFTAIDVSLLTR